MQDGLHKKMENFNCTAGLAPTVFRMLSGQYNEPNTTVVIIVLQSINIFYLSVACCIRQSHHDDNH